MESGNRVVPIFALRPSFSGTRAKFGTIKKVGFLNFPGHNISGFCLTLVYLTRVQRTRYFEGGGVEAWIIWYGIFPTHYSDTLHKFSVTIPRCYRDVYVNSFFPGTAGLWNFLPIESFPLTYDLNDFKSRINSHLLTVGSF